MGKGVRSSRGAQFVTYFGPVLDALRNLGGSGTPQEVCDEIAKTLSVSEKEQTEIMESGSARFPNRVAWARFYLAKEGLIDSSTRGIWSLTPVGASTHLDRAQAQALFFKWTEIFSNERRGRKSDSDSETEEDLDDAQAEIQGSHRTRLLDLVKNLPPSGFERLCQRLLRESGFTQVNVTGRSGDGGIDGIGILQVNSFVAFQVLFQCKRYQGSVSPSQVRDFRGAMQGRADKGIVITTGTFTAEARREATRDGVPPIELVDGEKLVDLFEERKLGLRPKTVYEVDEEFFNAFRV